MIQDGLTFFDRTAARIWYHSNGNLVVCNIYQSWKYICDNHAFLVFIGVSLLGNTRYNSDFFATSIVTLTTCQKCIRIFNLKSF